MGFFMSHFLFQAIRPEQKDDHAPWPWRNVVMNCVSPLQRMKYLHEAVRKESLQDDERLSVFMPRPDI